MVLGPAVVPIVVAKRGHSRAARRSPRCQCRTLTSCATLMSAVELQLRTELDLEIVEGSDAAYAGRTRRAILISIRAADARPADSRSGSGQPVSVPSPARVLKSLRARCQSRDALGRRNVRDRRSDGERTCAGRCVDRCGVRTHSRQHTRASPLAQRRRGGRRCSRPNRIHRVHSGPRWTSRTGGGHRRRNGRRLGLPTRRGGRGDRWGSRDHRAWAQHRAVVSQHGPTVASGCWNAAGDSTFARPSCHRGCSVRPARPCRGVGGRRTEPRQFRFSGASPSRVAQNVRRKRLGPLFRAKRFVPASVVCPMKPVLALAMVLGLSACSSSSTASTSSSTAEVKAPAPPSESTTTLSVGDSAPAFSLPGPTGAEVSLASLTANGPAVLVFYRGDW